MRVFSAEITGKTDEEKNTPLQNLQYQTYGKTLTKSGSKDGVRSMAMSLRTRWVCAGVALLTVGGITGCTTTDPFALKIKADLERTPAPLGQKKYAVVYADRSSEDLIQPHSEQLHAILRQLGYESAEDQDVKVAIYVLAYTDQLGTVPRQMNIRDVAGAMNPDSIRYKNLAAMRDKGRYEELIDDDPYAPGDIVMGPSGEIMYTGDLKREQMERDLPMKKVVGQRINRLVIRALEAPIPTDPEDVKIRWRVDVVSELPLDKPAPPMEKLVEAALDHLLKKHPKPAAAQP